MDLSVVRIAPSHTCLPTMPAVLRKIHVLRAAELALSDVITYPGNTATIADSAICSVRHVPNLVGPNKLSQTELADEMTKIITVNTDTIANFVAAHHNTAHVPRSTQLRLHRILLATCGQQKDAAATMSYLRHASARLHPDKTQFLSAHRVSNIAYMRSLGERYSYSHARFGARSQLGLLLACKDLLREPYMQNRLFDPVLALGGRVTVWQATEDWAKLGVVAGLCWAVVGGVGGPLGRLFLCSTPVLAAWHLLNLIIAIRKARGMFQRPNHHQQDLQMWANRILGAREEGDKNAPV